MPKITCLLVVLLFNQPVLQGEDKTLPPLILQAVQLLEVPADQVVALEHPKEFLVRRGMSEENSGKVQELNAAFVINNQLPVYININSHNNEYRQLERAFGNPKLSRQVVIMMASNIYHEYQHIEGRDEVQAMTAQLRFLEHFRSNGQLDKAADGFIAGQRQKLKEAKEGSASIISDAIR